MMMVVIMVSVLVLVAAVMTSRHHLQVARISLFRYSMKHARIYPIDLPSIAFHNLPQRA